MCINPTILPDGQMTGCRMCWECRQNKVDDWVGRCIAEAKTSVACHSVTLTYGGGDHERSAMLTYSDVQKFFKKLRIKGHKFSYIVCGEYGKEKQRAHWHVLFFWKNEPPEVEINKEYYTQIDWVHGYSFWEGFSEASVRYVCKYILKDTKDDDVDYHLSMSKKPPLGHAYFMQLAQDYVDASLAPQDLRYTFDDILTKKGERRKFYMAGVTARNFLEKYVELWDAQKDRHMPYSELVMEYLDKKEDENPAIILMEKGGINNYATACKIIEDQDEFVKVTNWLKEAGLDWETIIIRRNGSITSIRER